MKIANVEIIPFRVPPYLEEICNPLDADGYVTVPQAPGLGYRLNWDYIREHRIAQEPR